MLYYIPENGVKTEDIKAIYLTKSDAANTYLTSSTATSTYETISIAEEKFTSFC